MPKLCLLLWHTNTLEWNVIDVWRWADLFQRAVYLGLALMLGCTFFVSLRISRRYRLARRERSCLRLKPVAYLNRGLGTLRGISYAAPFLALTGTSYGILAAPSWFHYSGRAALLQDLASTLTNTALGILVAIPAISFHNLLETRLEGLCRRTPPKRNTREVELGSFQFAQTLPLRKRVSGLPHFAVLAAPVLVFLVFAYMLFKPYRLPTGLPVRLLPMGSLDNSARSATPILVSVIAGDDDEFTVRVNSKKVPSDKLTEVINQQVQGRTERQIYVEGDNGVRWADAAWVIDTIEGLHCRAILLTTTPARKTRRSRRAR